MSDDMPRSPTHLFARFYPEGQDQEIAGRTTVTLSPDGLTLTFPDETTVQLPDQALTEVYSSWLPGASFAAILLPGQGHLVLVGEAAAILFGIISRRVAHEVPLPATSMGAPPKAPEHSKPLNRLYVLDGCLVIMRADVSRAMYSRNETRIMYETF